MIRTEKFDWHVVNRSKRYPDPVNEHDINLLEQMGANIVLDRTQKIVYILDKRRNLTRRAMNERRKRFLTRWDPFR